MCNEAGAVGPNSMHSGCSEAACYCVNEKHALLHSQDNKSYRSTRCVWAPQLILRLLMLSTTAQATCWAEITSTSELTGCSWADNLQLSWQCAAELTECTAANLSWHVTAEASWYIPYLGKTCGQMKHVICSFPCHFSHGVRCRQQSAQSCCHLPHDYKNRLLYVLRSMLTIQSTGALPASKSAATCQLSWRTQKWAGYESWADHVQLSYLIATVELTGCCH